VGIGRAGLRRRELEKMNYPRRTEAPLSIGVMMLLIAGASVGIWLGVFNFNRPRG
jgi:hypothetical protein